MRRAGLARTTLVPQWFARIAVLVAAGCLAVACGGDGGGGEADAERVTKALNAGLQANMEGRVDEAVKQYREVLEMDKDNKFALYNLAVIDQGAGRLEDAEHAYRRVLQIDPAYAPALFNLAIIRTGRDNAEAISLYRRAIAARPEGADAHLNLGLLLKQQGDVAGGDAEIKKAIELNPELGTRAELTSTTTSSPSTSTTRKSR